MVPLEATNVILVHLVMALIQRRCSINQNWKWTEMNWLLKKLVHAKGGDNPFSCIFQEYISGCNASFPHAGKFHKFVTVSEMQWMLFVATSLTSAWGPGAYKLRMSICNSGLKSILYSHVNSFLTLPACSASKAAKPQLEPVLWEMLFWIHSWPAFKAEKFHSSPFWEIK